MKHALLLFLSADRLHAQVMSAGKISLSRNFIDTAEGRSDFSAFLKSVKCPAYLLTDLIEEDFRHEVVPHLSGKSRSALFQRKFDQFYRGTPFHQATLLQRQKTGRRDDEILFSALTNPSLITPWLNIMLAMNTPLVGIFSVPQISSPLVKDHPSKHLLLISWEKFSGLRQSYFSDHRLQISRLTPLSDEQSFTTAVIKELSRTYVYLKSLSLLPAGQTLDVRILCHANDINALKSQLPQNDDMRYDFADIVNVGKLQKIDHQFADSDASQIFLHQLASSKPKSDYANDEHTHFYNLWIFRRALNWGSGVLLLISLFWAAANVIQNSGNDEETLLLESQANRILQEVEMLTQNLPKTEALPIDMKSAVTIMSKLDQYQPSSITQLHNVSTSLNLFPKIQLGNIGWRTDSNEPIADNTNAEFPAQVITLQGNLNGFNGNYRDALTYLERFQIDIGKRGYQVEVLSKPLDISSTANLADQRDTNENPLRFTLKLAWRPAL